MFLTEGEKVLHVIKIFLHLLRKCYLSESTPLYISTRDFVSSKKKLATVRAIHEEIRVNCDGSFDPLMVRLKLQYGNRQNRLQYEIKNVHNAAKKIQTQLEALEVQ